MRRNGGFGVAAVIGVIGLLAVLGVFISSSFAGSASRTEKSEAKLIAQEMIRQATSIKDSINTLVKEDPEIGYPSVRLSTQPKGLVGITMMIGLYHPTDGNMEPVQSPRSAYVNPGLAYTYWAYQFYLANTFGTPSYTLVTSGIKLDVCEAINGIMNVPDAARTLTTQTEPGVLLYCLPGQFEGAFKMMISRG